ncbi:MAG: YfhO family protein [Verrucomicrobiae bacterium]|nr:YfhO family protein [Verrucomicrobiae bacterium]
MRSRALTLLVSAGLVAAVLAFFGPTLWGGCSLVPTDILHEIVRPYGNRTPIAHVQNHYTSDALVEDYPWAVFWQQTVRSGQLPLWNPFISGGHLHFALSMPAVFSPFKPLLLLGDAERMLSYSFVLQFVVAAISMFAFLRETGRSHFAAALGAVAWTFCSSLLMWYWRAPAIFCFAPLVLLLLDRAIRCRSWGYAAAAAGVLGLACLSGNIQAEVHLGLLCAAYALACVYWHGRHKDGVVCAQVAFALLIGALIAAVHWLPTLEALPRDVYNATTARGTHASLRHTVVGLPMLVTFVFPALTGSPETFDLLKLANASRSSFTAYTGLVPAGLALVAAVAVRRPQIRFWLGLIGGVLIVVFFTPLVKYLYHRVFVLIAFALAVLAAEGTDIVLNPAEHQRRAVSVAMRIILWLCIAVLVVVAVAQMVIAVKRPAFSDAARRYVLGRAHTTALGYKREWLAARAERFLDEYRIRNPRFWLPAACGIGMALAWRMRERHKLGVPVYAALLGTATLADIWVSNRPVVPQCDLRRYPLTVAHPLLPAPPTEDDLFRVSRWGSGWVFLFRPNLMMLAGLHDLNGSFSLSPPTVETLSFCGAGAAGKFLDMQNVRYLWVLSEEGLPADRFERVAEADGYTLYRNRTCLPRAWWVPRAEVITDRSRLLQRMLAEDFDPKKVVLLEEPPPFAGASNDGGASVKITRYTPLQVEVRVRSDDDGWLVLSDTWEKGWRAYVDGRQVRLYRANWVLRAVFVPRGARVVRFEFAPKEFQAGAALSLGATALTLAVLIGGSTVGSRRLRTRLTSAPPAGDSADTTR